MKNLESILRDSLSRRCLTTSHMADLWRHLYVYDAVDKLHVQLLVDVNMAVGSGDLKLEFAADCWDEAFLHALAAHIISRSALNETAVETQVMHFCGQIDYWGIPLGRVSALNDCIASKHLSKSSRVARLFVLETTKFIGKWGISDRDLRCLQIILLQDSATVGLKLSRGEADLIFEINDILESHGDNSMLWQKLFVQLISSHVLNDDGSPGVIDDDEAEWLIERINRDGQVDENEKKLIQHIKVKASGVSNVLWSQMRQWVKVLEDIQLFPKV